MTDMQEILSSANQIVQKYDLCNNCLGRIFSKQLGLSSNKLLGQKIRNHLKTSSRKCYVCKNLLQNLKPYLQLMLKSSEKFDYSTMLVGAIVKPSIIDRDDYIKSKYKLRGVDSVKADLTKELTKQFTRITKKRSDFLDPEITFTINFKNETCHIHSKFIMLQGRYNKTHGGIPQKQKSCLNCFGKGCRVCSYHGITEFDSVEGKISRFLFSTFGGTTAKFTWFGGEDNSSLVLGSGRPFVVKLQNPLKRNISLPRKIFLGPVLVNNCKVITRPLKKNPKFTSLIAIQIDTGNEIHSWNLRKLKTIHKKSVIIYEKSGKRSEKTIYDLKYKKTSKNSFMLTIKVDSGFPVKRFVESDYVTPGISSILGEFCSCRQFDFHEIETQ